MAILLVVLSAISGFLLFPHVTAENVLFSSPLQILFGGETLTDGDLKLALGHNCSLVLYDGEEAIWDANTTLATSHCALFVQDSGQLLLIGDTETVQVVHLGTAGNYGRYALLVANGKLGIYGPALWCNGVGSALARPNKLFSRELSTSPPYPNRILFSGKAITGSKDEDLTLLVYNHFSAVLTKRCTLAVVLVVEFPWTAWETDLGRELTGECQLELRFDGEVFIGDHVTYENGTEATYKVWSSGYNSTTGDYFMALRYTGELLVFGSNQWLYEGEASTIKMMTRE